MDAEVIYCTNCGSANEQGTKFCFKCGTPMKTVPIPTITKDNSDFITLACPKCGGQLEVTPDMDRFSCKYCGNEHIVKRNGSNVSLTPVVEGIKRVEQKFDHVLSGSDRLAAEQTIQRLKNEIIDLEKVVEQKQAAFNVLETQLEIIPGKKLVRTGIWLMIPQTIIFFLLAGLFFGGLYIDVLGYISIAIMVISFISGLICIIVGSARNHKAKNQKRMIEKEALLAKAHEEMDQAKAHLKDHQKRLEDLHRYTTER